MSNPNDTNTTTDPREATPNAGEATAEEAKLIAAGTDVDDEGNPTDAAAEAAAKAAQDEAAAKAQADADAAAAKKAEEDAAAAAAETPQPAAQPVVVNLPKPEPPQDFAAERAKLKTAYDNGEIDQDEYLDKRDAITVAEGAYQGRLAAWETQVANAQETIKANAEAAFTAEAQAWEKRNADFMANPLRADMMQQAIAAVDKQTGYKLSPAELFKKAEEVAFQAANYTPPAATPAPTPSGKTVEEIAREALAGRKPSAADTPATLRTAPQAAGLDPNNAAYDTLDRLPISDLEDTLARMTPEQAAKFLADTPGSDSRGQAD